MAIVKAILGGKITDGELYYVYPKTTSDMVDYTVDTTVEDKLKEVDENLGTIVETATILKAKVDEHLASRGNPHQVTTTQIGAVPVTRTVNNKTLTRDIVLDYSDVGAVSNQITINGHDMNSNVELEPSDIGAVSTSTKINNKALTGDITLTPSDIGAAQAAHTHTTSEIVNDGSVFNADQIPGLDADKITSGILPVERGGTGANTFPAGSYLMGNDTGEIVTRTPAQVLSNIGAASLSEIQMARIAGDGSSKSTLADRLNSDYSSLSSSIEELASNSGSALQDHLNDKNNPHEVTTTQIGAATKTEFDTHANNKNNPHQVTTTQIGAVPTTTTINGHALTTNITLTPSDIGAPSTSTFNSHINNKNNPHEVTIEQIGAASIEEIEDARTAKDGTNCESLSDRLDTDYTNIMDTIDEVASSASAAGSAANNITLESLGAAAASDLSDHLNDKNNPHQVTTTQIGAATAIDLNSHINNKSNPHQVTTTQIGAVPTTTKINGHTLTTNITLTPSDINAVSTSTKINNKALTGDITLTPSDIGAASTTSFTDHTNDTDNPHQVTTTQIGAATATDLSAHINNKNNPHEVTTTQIGAVPTSRTINGKSLTGNITLTPSDIGAATDDEIEDARVASVDGSTKTSLAERLTIDYNALKAMIDVLSGDTSGSGSDIASHIANKNNPHEVTTTQIGAVPITRTVNSKALSSNITLNASDVGAVPTTRTVNGKALSSNITLDATDVGAISGDVTINGYNLTNNINLSASDVGAVDSSITINGKYMTSNVELTYSDVGAAAASHGVHVTYSTSNPLVDGTASPGTATTVARSDHRHPTDTTRAAASDLTSHTSNTNNPHNTTADQVGAVPTTRTVNGKALSSNISLTASDVGAAMETSGTATCPAASSWSTNSTTGLYYVTVSISGFDSTTKAHITPTISTTDTSTGDAQQAAWDTHYYSETVSGGITFYAKTKPTTAVQFTWQVVA